MFEKFIKFVYILYRLNKACNTIEQMKNVLQPNCNKETAKKLSDDCLIIFSEFL